MNVLDAASKNNREKRQPSGENAEVQIPPPVIKGALRGGQSDEEKTLLILNRLCTQRSE